MNPGPIPDVLKATPQWVVYRLIPDGEKTDKVPVDPRTGRNVNAHDPANWLAFGRAVELSARFDGAGFVFTEGDPFCGADLDKCIRPDGKIEPWAEMVVDCFQSYSERSRSGDGIHIIMVGRMPEGFGHVVNGQGTDGRGKIEVYDRKRFFTFTGDRIGEIAEVRDRQEELEAFCRARLPIAALAPGEPAPADPNGLPDEDVLRMARMVPHGERFRALFDDGDLSAYDGDWSRADMALVNFLAFWTGGDAAAVDRLFRLSALMREKWDRKLGPTTYGGATIAKVLATLRATYRHEAEAGADPGDPGPPDDGDAKPGVLDGALGRLPLTDLGNAERLVARHGRDLRYCHPWGCWLAWDGRRWAVDVTAAARHRARETVRAIGREASREDDDERRKALFKWALTSEKRDRIAAMLHLGEAEAGIPILPGALNADPYAFNCNNGTIDLRTGALRPHRRADLITQLCPLDYDPYAPCPLWLSTLDFFFHRESSRAKEEMIGYWQRLCGYAMLGIIRDHIMPVAYGTGSNGKSTILGTLLDVFGPDYAMKCPPDMLMARKADAHPTDRADLFGKRLVVAIETEAGRRLNETMVKELTGSDRIRARRMRENFWEFNPTHTLIMATNHKPVVRGTDLGIWRRIKLVPFTVAVDDDRADKAMCEKLRSEFSGILGWCIRGCLLWRERGLDAPSEIIEATDGYRQEQDLIGAFFEECCVTGPQYRVRAGALYARYKVWAEACNEFVITQRAFGTSIQEKGIEKKVSGGKWYLGIAVRDDSDGPDDPDQSGPVGPVRPDF